MNRQIISGYDAFAKAEHQRLIDVAARDRLISRARRQPKAKSERTLWSVLNSQLTYAAAGAVLAMIIVVTSNF